MTWASFGMMPDLRWEVAGVALAFSTAADGDLREPALRNAWLERLGAPSPVAVPEQIHGADLAQARSGWHPRVDGLVVGPTIGTAVVFGADCPGLVVVGPTHLVIAHSGWRGVAAGIVDRACEALRAQGDPIHAAFIGPGISGSRYEVDDPVLSAYPWPSVALAPSRENHAFLDLPSAIAETLRKQGITAIHQANTCTASDSRLHSYRHQGKGLVQALAAWRLPISANTPVDGSDSFH
jgi:copper oxidase (laccase) domain-containing protein